MAVKIGDKLSIPEAFHLAISEAKKGLGFVSPNPAVGCVFLDKDNHLRSVGYHRSYGGPHAEVEAHGKVQNLESLVGGKAIVTLEPCSHFGKTPPCADLLSRLSLSEVHYGLRDPNPLVSGRGLRKLEESGVKVFSAPKDLESSLKELVEIFYLNQTEKRCFVGLKVASSLDGQMSLPSGDSQWITGPLAREKSHFLRAYFGAVLTTASSVMRDNSSLNSRVEPFHDKEIPVFLIDRKGRSADFLQDSKLLEVRDAKSLYVFTSQDHLKSYTCLPTSQVIDLKSDSDRDQLREIFKFVTHLGFSSLMIEAGPQFTSLILRENLYDRLDLFVGPKVLGAHLKTSWTKGLEFSNMDQVLSFESAEPKTLGGDIWISARNPSAFFDSKL
ncbi:MAG: bifunctional diaminohydroxyphosphoribosylaminopyrimidine deaminase/5-amino-6-(5-phosphoribosylamino)uracil reductase RibD [Bdellovibrionales bacterium]|nr:bifunctional diaminohydroxyphosphoribosylaminopyrimidine deaminase/5-amino-6-(5-phosphoribosylamino)uracil reductase RibD [Bdellovibrionales bacterium]